VEIIWVFRKIALHRPSSYESMIIPRMDFVLMLHLGISCAGYPYTSHSRPGASVRVRRRANGCQPSCLVHVPLYVPVS